jgi:hypothetical protein
VARGYRRSHRGMKWRRRLTAKEGMWYYKLALESQIGI